MAFWKRLRLTLDMIKFEHSVFALPFALTGALLAFRESRFARQRFGYKLLWIVVAMVGARSAAMAFNRILDADIDARNPRTRMRHIPAGILEHAFCVGLRCLSRLLVFLLAARALNPLCLRLAPVALAVVFFYSFTKRFTSFSHLILGFSLGIAPAAAWIAVRGSLDPRILWLTAAVTFLDRRLRHHLLVPGLRIRFKRRSVQSAAPLRHVGSAVDRSRCSTSR